MGYSLTTSLARPAARSHASPKTHVPLSRLQERGLRYYSPTLGRWVSRDPIGEFGGVNVYCCLANELMLRADYLGLLNVIDDGQKLKDLVPEFHPKEYFLDNRYWSPLEPPASRDPMSIGGGTTYVDTKPVVRCSCSEIAGDGDSSSGSAAANPRVRRSGPCCVVTCTVTWRAKVALNQDWNMNASWDQPRSMLGAWGHEQLHVQAKQYKVRVSVIEPLSRRTAVFQTMGECARAAANYSAHYTSALFTVTSGGESHAGSDPRAPAQGQPYPPLPDTPLPVPPSAREGSNGGGS
jgi:RHS repeat-associated protein